MHKIAQEAGRPAILLGSGQEYQRLAAVAATGRPIIVPLNYPEAPEVASLADANSVSLRELMAWEQAPTNLRRLSDAGVSLALTTHRLDKASDFWPNLRKAVEMGLPADRALAALTITPANMLGAQDRLGTIDAGKLANLAVFEGDPFTDEDAELREVWSSGVRQQINEKKEDRFDGAWALRAGERASGELTISKNASAVALESGDDTLKARNVSASADRISFVLQGDALEAPGAYRFSAIASGETLAGTGVAPDGETFSWSASRSPDEARGAKAGVRPRHERRHLDRRRPRRHRGRRPHHPRRNRPLRRPRLPRPQDRRRPHHRRPGQARHPRPLRRPLPHGHLGRRQRGRPGRHRRSPHRRRHRPRQSAGTAARRRAHRRQPAPRLGQPHRRAELRRQAPLGRDHPDDMRLEGAPGGIKFALGENVKQSNWGRAQNTRYPQTRMGVETIIRDRFVAAREYDRVAGVRQTSPTARAHRPPPPRDLELEAIAEILNGERLIHCHSYRQDEILMLCRSPRSSASPSAPSSTCWKATRSPRRSRSTPSAAPPSPTGGPTSSRSSTPSPRTARSCTTWASSSPSTPIPTNSHVA